MTREQELLDKLKKGYDLANEYLKQYPVKGDKALEIGCGIGAITLAHAKFFNHIDALDISYAFQDDLLKTIDHNSLSKIKVMLKDATEFIQPNTYDFVFSYSAFEHIKGWKVVLENIHKSLKKGGKVRIVASPLYYSERGHHLYPLIEDWEHLELAEDELEKLFFKRGGKDWKWALFQQLNKMTIPEFMQEAKKYFKVLSLRNKRSTLDFIGEKV